MLLSTFCLSPSLHLPIHNINDTLSPQNNSCSQTYHTITDSKYQENNIIIILFLEKHVTYLWSLLHIVSLTHFL